MTVPSSLAELRVIECAGWNGVLAGRLLADAGADVVRVVPPSGDPMASERPFFGAKGPSIQATWYNAGKRVLALDLESANGRAEFLRLVAAADILIEDWDPAARPVPGDALVEANSALTRVSVTPMGLDGPLAELARKRPGGQCPLGVGIGHRQRFHTAHFRLRQPEPPHRRAVCRRLRFGGPPCRQSEPRIPAR